ncbi:translocation/assembly module TamB domain-containing protein [Sedimentitalea todarodis]|uniref:Translocation/assembly module TamB domain-containing protein n=1 Tax=Sedimentitalea todarodis TaxID=1631240 RepID=A0ABU3VFW6_9RHOB|nr:translocation/assembly module TamB domain-containing protein [Sedimentitalea todarodis]MDU9005071.1 translocation/assembly module TamB domain-containing protein [Sedimentitalea todarodis]
MRIVTCALIALTCCSSIVHAQEDDESGGFLVDLLQDNLSGNNRYIKVSGLDGAFSSQASIEKLTVSDDDGVWLTVSDVVLDWNRLALIRGRFSVNTLSAGEIIVARKPKPIEAAEPLPTAEATPFQLPDLPVAIELGELKVERVELGEPLMGIAAELSVTGALSLADGSLDTNFEVIRLDRQTDKLDLIAGFENASSLISLDLTLAEDDGGLVSELLSIPDRPSILLTAKGEGPVSDFTANIALTSDDVERLGGQVRLQSVTDPDAGNTAQPSIGFDANMAGDITPLLATEYREFFGADTQLNLTGQSDPDGRMEIRRFDMLSDALMLNGALDIAESGQLERVLLQGRIAPPNGNEVVLPMGEPRTAIQAAVLSAEFEADKDNAWSLVLSVDGLNRPDLTVTRSQIYAGGELDQAAGMSLDGNLNAAIRGIDLTDDALDDAVGTDIELNGNFAAETGSVLKLSDFVVSGTDYAATVNAEIDGLESGFQVDGEAGLTASDLSRFSGVAGRDLGGSVTATVSGQGAPLSGMFDFDLNVASQDLRSGIAQIDPLITGETTIVLQAERDEDGLDIRRFNLDGTALTADASGTMRSSDTNMEFNARLDDLARIVPDLSGPVVIKGDLVQTPSAATGKLRVTGPSESFADLDGSLSPDGAVDVTYEAELGGVEKFVPQLVGIIRAKGRATRLDDTWQVTSDVKGPSGSSVELAGSMTPEGAIDGRYDATIARVERFVPQLVGSITAEGTVERADNAWKVASDVKGPTGSFAQFAGTMTPEGTIDASYDATFAKVERFVPQVVGSINAKGTAKRVGNAWQVASDVKGPTGSVARLSGSMSPEGDIDANYDATFAKIERFVPQLVGSVNAKGTASRVDETWKVASDVKGPTGSVAQLAGSMSPDGTIDARYDATIAKVERFVPELAGSVDINGTAKRADNTWQVATDANGPSGSVAKLSGSMAPDGNIDAAYDATVVRIERFLPEFPGQLTAKGTAARDSDIWTIATEAKGPGGLSTKIGGTVNQITLVSDVTAKGQVQLAAANRFIKPNSLRGTANFDLALKGEPKPESLSGRITTANTTVAIPSVMQAIDDLDAEIVLANGSANLSVSAAARAGGRLVITGPIKLAPPFNASIVTEIQQLILTDNVTFDSSANGRIAFTGALTGRGLLAGDIRFGETNININALSGSPGAAPIPDITYIGETGAQRATRDRAGLIKSSSGSGGGPDIGLDIQLVAENKVFVRGRGLQAELGGNIQVRGTVAKVAPSGQINLIRGTLELLGRRLKLTKGLVTLQGNLEPYMEFAATTSTSDGDARLEISGPITKPKVKVESDPERPSEEALAMLLFGNQYSELSPIKIAQLAASLATLSGAGGGANAKARDELGVDTFDIGSDDDGNAQFGAGKYLADGVYTDITVNTDGDTEVNLNLDVTESLTVKGSVDRQGDTGIGLFFERDY